MELFPRHWTQICMLSNNDILSHVTASELFPVTLGNAMQFSFIFALGKISFVQISL